jgi:hypothetical protein
LYDGDVYKAKENPETSVLEIDEIPENQDLCREIAYGATFRNVDDLGRWYIENGELHEREGWQPAPGMLL